MRALRAHDRLAVADDRVRELREQQRAGRQRPATLGGVGPVVEADAHDLARERDRGHQLDRVERGPRAPSSTSARRRRSSSASGSRSMPVRKPSKTGIRRSPTRTAVPASSIAEVRDEPHRPGRQLADGARARGGARGRALARERAGGRGRRVALGVGWLGRRARWSGSRSGTAHCFSGFVRSPHWSQKARILAWSNVSSWSTRPQRIAWNGVGHLVEPGDHRPIAPLGVPGRREGVVERRTGPGPRRSRRCCCPGRARPGRRAPGCGSSPAG